MISCEFIDLIDMLYDARTFQRFNHIFLHMRFTNTHLEVFTGKGEMWRITKQNIFNCLKNQSTKCKKLFGRILIINDDTAFSALLNAINS